MVRTASTRGEVLTGGDPGITVDLRVGNLRVLKVAIFQGKVSTNGVADIGSKPSGPDKSTQLKKLSIPDRGCYLFYHNAVGAWPSGLPAVTPADHFVSTLGLDEDGLTRPHVRVDTRGFGWDLASFVAFGLCSRVAGLGLAVPAGSDPLDALKAGGRTTQAEYVVLVSLGDDVPAYQRYLSKLSRENDRSLAREPERSGPDDVELDIF